MAKVMSNHLKALLFLDDITISPVAPSRDKGYTVQHFEYRCERSVDDNGIPFGSTLSVILKTSLKITSPNAGKALFERLKQNERYPFTFLFNATFDDDQKVADYGDGMVVYGYVVDIEESHVWASDEAESEQQMLIAFDILVASITYLGRDNNKSLYIIHSCD